MDIPKTGLNPAVPQTTTENQKTEQAQQQKEPLGVGGSRDGMENAQPAPLNGSQPPVTSPQISPADPNSSGLKIDPTKIKDVRGLRGDIHGRGLEPKDPSGLGPGPKPNVEFDPPLKTTTPPLFPPIDPDQVKKIKEFIQEGKSTSTPPTPPPQPPIKFDPTKAEDTTGLRGKILGRGIENNVPQGPKPETNSPLLPKDPLPTPKPLPPVDPEQEKKLREFLQPPSQTQPPPQTQPQQPPTQSAPNIFQRFLRFIGF